MILKLGDLLVDTTSVVIARSDNQDERGNCCVHPAGSLEDCFYCEETIEEIIQQIKEGGVCGTN